MSDQTRANKERWWAAGGTFGALLASSCCIAPLVLVTLGIGGAWIGSLTKLEPYKWAFITIAATLLGLGFWQVYFRAAEPCEDGTYCARPQAHLIVKSALWLAAALIIASATVAWWAPQFH